MSERTDVYAYFWVQEYASPHDEISTRLQLEPTSTRTVGEIGRYGAPAKFNRWELLSPLARGEGLIQDYLESLLSLVEPSAAAVRELSAKYAAGINCVGYYYGSNPGLHLSGALLARLAALEISVDFDLYNYSESDVT